MPSDGSPQGFRGFCPVGGGGGGRESSKGLLGRRRGAGRGRTGPWLEPCGTGGACQGEPESPWGDPCPCASYPCPPCPLRSLMALRGRAVIGEIAARRWIVAPAGASGHVDQMGRKVVVDGTPLARRPEQVGGDRLRMCGMVRPGIPAAPRRTAAARAAPAEPGSPSIWTRMMYWPIWRRSPLRRRQGSSTRWWYGSRRCRCARRR